MKMPYGVERSETAATHGAPPVGRKPAWWEGTECGYGVFRANHERISTRPIERHREIVEALFR